MLVWSWWRPGIYRAASRVFAQRDWRALTVRLADVLREVGNQTDEATGKHHPQESPYYTTPPFTSVTAHASIPPKLIALLLPHHCSPNR